MFCRNCGSSIGEKAKFCAKCGAEVQGDQELPVADNDSVAMPVDSCKVLPAEKINKKEYFATLCSPRARKIMIASWIVWTVNVLSTIYFASISNLVKMTNKTYKFWELTEFVQNEQDSGLVAFVILGAGWMIGSILLTTIVGGVACRKKSVPLSVAFLIVTLFSMLPVKAINLVAAICILIFNIVVNREYKKYMKLEDAK